MKYSAFIILFVLFITSCTEKIDIDLDTTYQRFIVEGTITTDTMKHGVKLSKSIDYYNIEQPPTLSNAIVTIDDGFNEITLEENQQNPGYYETDENYFWVVGRTYKLEIELQEEINGHSSFSASSELKPVAPIDSIMVVYIEKWEVWELKIYALDPPSEDFYSFEVIKNGIEMTDTVTKRGISDDRYFNGNYTFGISVYYFNSRYEPEVVNPGDTITLRMGGITKDYYNFLVELMDQTFEYRNPMFSGPPANIRTNISNEGLGFFTAYSTSYSSTIYSE
ncbi:MAG: DUF4249 domain-containing protein [Bacteroidales bacterium]|nr:DUF4249 domain-containing protein [Bacteroidales bacterium]